MTQIEGVGRVEADPPRIVQTIRVAVPSRDSEAGRQVYALEEEIRKQYPEAELDVWVSEAP